MDADNINETPTKSGCSFHFMLDNHTFIRLTGDYEQDMELIKTKWAICQNGSLFIRHDDHTLNKVVHADEDFPAFCEECKGIYTI